MKFFDSIKAFWSNYANFKGRTSKVTFWWTILFLALASAAVSLVFPGTYITETIWAGFEVSDYKESAVENLWMLATLLPSIALTVRRFHDIGRSGKSFWWLLVPIAGFMMLFIWCLAKGNEGSNEYGEAVK
jgi:uncharacterized membrane protein YhaH (DUF805 family)